MIDATPLPIGVAAVVGLLVVSAFFSSSEIAIFSLPPEWIESAAAGGNHRANTLATLRADPHRLLVTLLVGNNLVNVALSSIVAVGVGSVLPDGQAVVASTVLASTVVLVFGEILPKSLGLGHAREWSLRVARPLVLCQLALFPIVAVFDAVNGRLSVLVGGSPDIEQPYAE